MRVNLVINHRPETVWNVLLFARLWSFVSYEYLWKMTPILFFNIYIYSVEETKHWWKKCYCIELSTPRDLNGRVLDSLSMNCKIVYYTLGVERSTLWWRTKRDREFYISSAKWKKSEMAVGWTRWSTEIWPPDEKCSELEPARSCATKRRAI